MGQIHKPEDGVEIRGRRDIEINSDVPSLSPQQLSAKYEQSWTNATDVQRVSICNRFGLRYTHKEDKDLLIVVAQKQQDEYDRVFESLDRVLTKASWVDTFGKAMAMKKSPKDAEREANKNFPNAW